MGALSPGTIKDSKDEGIATSVNIKNPERFTIDGSDALEERLSRLCDQVREGLQRIIPAVKLEAIVLGGGYGRGEGGVLHTNGGDEPYNDIEFYVFLRGPRLLNQRWYGNEVCSLAEELSSNCSLHVEFKLDSLRRLRTMPVSMFSYDLVSAHRLLFGSMDVFKGCEHHFAADCIPLSEATRLLYNRCGGLLLVRERLAANMLSDEDADFIGRNLAKASLALGDAVLVSATEYHWSAMERNVRLERLADAGPVDINVLRKHHRAGLEFKLHPQRANKTRQEFAAEHRELSSLAQKLWLWIESQRLGRPFLNIHEYVFSGIDKCPETASGRNVLLNMRTFGPLAAVGPLASHYPRERLLNSLPLLLWNGEVSREPEVRRHLRKQLRSEASDWAGFVAAYKEIWPAYG
jgi:hypothetical protein